jgi:hypothetical protein
MPSLCLLPVLLACSVPVFAQKCTWNVSGKWTIKQSNGIRVKLSLRQVGKEVAGTASYQGMKQGRRHTETGDATGTWSDLETTRPFLLLRIAWDYGETGDYRGTINTTFGILSGRQRIAEDAGNESRSSNFRFVEEVPCVPVK